MFRFRKNKENLLKYGFDEKEVDQAIQKVKNRNLDRGISEWKSIII